MNTPALETLTRHSSVTVRNHAHNAIRLARQAKAALALVEALAEYANTHGGSVEGFDFSNFRSAPKAGA